MLELVYRGSDHGFTAQAFHQQLERDVNNLRKSSATLTFVLSEHGKAFGGYTTVPWSFDDTYQDFEDSEAFVFSMTHRTKHEQYQLKDKAVRHYPSYLPTFGYSHDFHICDNCDQERNSHSLFGHSSNGTYQLEPDLGIEKDSEEAFNYIAGSQNFLVKEIEVFKVYFLI